MPPSPDDPTPGGLDLTPDRLDVLAARLYSARRDDTLTLNGRALHSALARVALVVLVDGVWYITDYGAAVLAHSCLS